MEKTIWMVTETLLKDSGVTEKNNIGYYSTREKAIDAVYLYLASDFEDDDLEDQVEKTLDDADDPSGNLTITTHCGEKYGMYDCEYYIEEYPLDEEFGT